MRPIAVEALSELAASVLPAKSEAVISKAWDSVFFQALLNWERTVGWGLLVSEYADNTGYSPNRIPPVLPW